MQLTFDLKFPLNNSFIHFCSPQWTVYKSGSGEMLAKFGYKNLTFGFRIQSGLLKKGKKKQKSRLSISTDTHMNIQTCMLAYTESCWSRRCDPSCLVSSILLSATPSPDFHFFPMLLFLLFPFIILYIFLSFRKHTLQWKRRNGFFVLSNQIEFHENFICFDYVKIR